MENNGFEIQLGYNDREGDFKWNASANLSFVTNEVTKLAEGVTNIEAGADQDFGTYNITNTAVWPTYSVFLWLGSGRYFPECSRSWPVMLFTDLLATVSWRS